MSRNEQRSRRAPLYAAGLLLVAIAIIAPLSRATSTVPRVPPAIARAALAPYRDFLARDAASLCTDFTPTARARFGPGNERVCAARVAVKLRATFAVALPILTRGNALRVSAVSRRGNEFTAELAYGRKGATFTMTLRRLHGRLLVASNPHLSSLLGCLPASPCPAGASTAVFWIGLPAYGAPVRGG